MVATTAKARPPTPTGGIFIYKAKEPEDGADGQITNNCHSTRFYLEVTQGVGEERALNPPPPPPPPRPRERTGGWSGRATPPGSSGSDTGGGGEGERLPPPPPPPPPRHYFVTSFQSSAAG